MYCDPWSYVLWPLHFQIQKRIVSAETIWGNTVDINGNRLWCLFFLVWIRTIFVWVNKPLNGLKVTWFVMAPRYVLLPFCNGVCNSSAKPPLRTPLPKWGVHIPWGTFFSPSWLMILWPTRKHKSGILDCCAISFGKKENIQNCSI